MQRGGAAPLHMVYSIQLKDSVSLLGTAKVKSWLCVCVFSDRVTVRRTVSFHAQEDFVFILLGRMLIWQHPAVVIIYRTVTASPL